MPAYSDLHDLPEDERIQVIANLVKLGQRIAFFVDTKPKAKAGRYLDKLKVLIPDLLVHTVVKDSPTKGCTTCVVSLPAPMS